MKLKKRVLVAVSSAFLAAGVPAQSSEEISLPDLTTVISSGGEEEAVTAPDFSDVVDFPPALPSIEPVLPDAVTPRTAASDGTGLGDSAKTVYAEGQLGGGYPVNVTGDFTISRILGKNPFKLSFSHNSISGFSGNPLYAGFSSRSTRLYAEKLLGFDSVDLKLSGGYEDLGTGLQSRARNVSALNQDRLKLNADFSCILPAGFKAGASASSGLYFRFADLALQAPGTAVPDWVKSASVLDVSPRVFVKWQNFGFEAGLTADYLFLLDAAGTLADYGITSRLQVDLDFAWKNEFVRAFGTAGVVLGNRLNGRTVAVPFNAGAELFIPVAFSERTLALRLSGGIASSLASIYELEKLYKFAEFSFLPSEATSLVIRADLSLPVKDFFTANASVEYKKNLFNSGNWIPSYAQGAPSDGVYSYISAMQEFLSTRLDLTCRYKLLAVSAGWHSDWLDVPVLESSQNLCFNLSLQPDSGRLGLTLGAELALSADDKTPKINAEGFVQLTPAVKLVLKTEDFVKLITAGSRTYAGSYITTGGTVTLLAKFLF